MRLPFVSRAAFDQATAQATAADERARRAEERANLAWVEAKELMAEARAGMRDAIAMSKIASASLFGREETGEPPKPSSVQANDRKRARELAEMGAE